MILKPMAEQHLGGKNDDMVLTILQKTGPQTMETLSSASGLQWQQVFLVIDRLSRAGLVALRQVRPCLYEVAPRQYQQQQTQAAIQ